MKGWTERAIQRELFRMKRKTSASLVFPNWTPLDWWECDLIVVSKAGYWNEIEIKLSLADYEADERKGKTRRFFKGCANELDEQSKHGQLAKSMTVKGKGPKTFTFVLPLELAEQIEPPDHAGLIGLEKRGRYMRQIELKKAPVLQSAKLSDQNRSKLLTAAYWRYWNQRNRTR